MPLLDFICVGMPKSGTSSLCSWLDAHPEIEGSKPKETFFLMDQEHPLVDALHDRGGATVHETSIESYNSFFSNSITKKIRFEGTTHYFYQDTALKILSEQKSPPLVIFILRKPSEKIYSSFKFTQGNLGGISKSFEFSQYVELLLSGNLKNAEKHFHLKPSFWIAERELELSYYAKWIRHWQQAITRQHLEIILFDDLKENPKNILSKLCHRLGVDATFYQKFEFPVHNKTTSIRNSYVHRLARRLSSQLPKGTFKLWGKNIYKKLQITSSGLTVSDDDKLALDRLDKYFEPLNLELEEQFQLDLSSWRKTRA